MGFIGTALIAGATYYLTKSHCMRKAKLQRALAPVVAAPVVAPPVTVIGEQPASSVVAVIEEEPVEGLYGCPGSAY